MAVTELRATSEARLAELEQVIDKGLVTFVEVGRALAEIAEFKLYLLAGFKTFPEYTTQRLGLTRTGAYNKMYASKVVAVLDEPDNPGALPLPRNETQAKALAPLLDKPDELRQAWQEAYVQQGERGVPPKALRTAVNKRMGREDRRTMSGRPPRMVRCPECGHDFRVKDNAPPKHDVAAVAE